MQPKPGVVVLPVQMSQKPLTESNVHVLLPAKAPSASNWKMAIPERLMEFKIRFGSLSLRANISETVLVLLINEQGEKEKGRDEREFSWCSFFGGIGWRGTERRRAERAEAEWSGSP